MQTYESMELLGMQADTLENLLGAMQLQLPAQTHLDRLRPALEGVMQKLREVYVLETGENPWAPMTAQTEIAALLAPIKEALQAGPTPGPLELCYLSTPKDKIGEYVQQCVDVETGGPQYFFIRTVRPDGVPVDVAHYGNGPTSNVNGHFATVCNPERMAALIAAVEALAAERDALRVEARNWLAANGPGGWIDALRVDAERWRFLCSASMEQRNLLEHYAGHALNEAIDAARTQEPAP